MSVNIYVGNLPYSITNESLQDIFAPYGSIVSAKVIIDRNTQRSRGFGFVEMESQEEADNAISELNDAEVDGRTITVNIAKPRTERPPRRDFHKRGPE